LYTVDIMVITAVITVADIMVITAGITDTMRVIMKVITESIAVESGMVTIRIGMVIMRIGMGIMVIERVIGVAVLN
jgi:hypothetical protein